MLLLIDGASSQPIHDQIAGQIRKEIASGALQTGERLPPAKELSASLSVNVHTVLRAYQTLRDEELVEVRRGRGTIVTGAPLLAGLSELAKSLVAEARHAGVNDDQIRQLLESHL